MNRDVTSAAPTAPTGHDLPQPLPTLGAILWLAWFSVREMARRRRLVSLALINLLPVLVVAAVRIWFQSEGITAQMQLAALSHDTYMTFLIPIAAMAVGIPAIGEQVDDGTIVFTWVRPVRRRAIYLGRLLAAQSVATILMFTSLALCFLVMISAGLNVITWDLLKLYLQTYLIIGLGVFTYAALFAAMGTFFKKPVLPAILFAFGWESLVTNIPARVQELSLRFHLQNLIERPPATPDDLPGLLGALLSAQFNRDPVPKLQSIAVLFIVGALATLVGIWLLKHKEIEN